MNTLLIKKFQHNPELNEKLKSTQQKKLCEAGKHKFFAIGLQFNHKTLTDEKAWLGENKLGKALMEVRDSCV